MESGIRRFINRFIDMSVCSVFIVLCVFCILYFICILFVFCCLLGVLNLVMMMMNE